jgi:hypothetical protein
MAEWMDGCERLALGNAVLEDNSFDGLLSSSDIAVDE